MAHRLSCSAACGIFSDQGSNPFPCIGRRILLKFIYLCIYLFLAALGLGCCTQAFSSCDEWGLLFVAVRGLLIAVASFVVEHGFQAHRL